MRVVLLGTGSPLPHPDRAGPATLIRSGGTDVLVDCGRGVLMRLAGAAGGPGSLAAVFLTHLHSDHVQDLSDVITMRWAASIADEALRVVGPVGTAGFVDRTLAMMQDDIGYRMAHHADLRWRPRVEVTEVGDEDVVEYGPLRATAAIVDHGVVRPAVGFRFEDAAGAAVVSGDTVPCTGLDRICEGAAVYVQTVLRRKLVEAVKFARFQDILDYHSSTEDAGRTAGRAGVRTLAMTHLIPAPLPGTEEEWSQEASAHFGGEVIVGRDLLALDT